MAKRVQVIPLEVLLGEQPQHKMRREEAIARFLLGTWSGWFMTRKESTFAVVCFLLQTLLLGLLQTFNLLTDYAPCKSGSKSI
jgi:hypothetical protein